MVNKNQTVGSNAGVNTYTELYTKNLLVKHGAVIVPETVTRKVIGMVYFSDDGKAYETQAEADVADANWVVVMARAKETKQNRVRDAITRKANAMKNKGWKVSKLKKSA